MGLNPNALNAMHSMTAVYPSMQPVPTNQPPIQLSLPNTMSSSKITTNMKDFSVPILVRNKSVQESETRARYFGVSMRSSCPTAHR